MMEDFADGEAVHLGQHEIEDNEVRQAGAGLVEGFAAVGGGDDVITLRPEVEADQFDDVRLIVHHKNLISHNISLTRRADRPQQQDGYGSVTNWGNDLAVKEHKDRTEKARRKTEE